MSPRLEKKRMESETIMPFDDGEVVELALCLPGWQVECLEAAAHERGLTAAQFLRRMIHDTLDECVAPPPSAYFG
jgi:hypothetical protein